MFKRKICLTCGTVYIVGLTGNQYGCNGCIVPEPKTPKVTQPKEEIVAVKKNNSYGK